MPARDVLLATAAGKAIRFPVGRGAAVNADAIPAACAESGWRPDDRGDFPFHP